MDNYIVSARKYRPTTFHSVVGQEALTATLRNAISSGKLAHAYLFCGPRGVGKTTCARIFAKTINCFNPTVQHEACNECESCVAFNEQRSYNIHELDAASNNSVDDIRALIEQVRIPPQIGKYKVYIIDEVHMLSTSAFNSFLKTLEEPPTHAIFVLATTEKHKIIPTIISRCQVYDFSRITVADTVNHLQHVAQQEGVKAEPEALNIIAQKADGGMRDALSIFDQVVSFTQGCITYKAVIENLNVLDYEYYFRFTDAIIAGDVVSCLLILNDVLNRGFEGQYIISGISSHFRDLLVCKNFASAKLLQVGASIRERYIETSKRCDEHFLFKAIEIANDCDLNYRLSKNKRLLLELTMIKLCQLSENPTPQRTDEKKNEIKAITPSSNLPPIEYKEEISEQKNDVPDSVVKETKTTPILQRKPEEVSNTPKELGISLVSLKKTQQENRTEEKPSEKTQKSVSYSPFTEEELVAAWNEFAAGLKTEKLLKNTMELYSPCVKTNEVFEVVVSNEINKNYLENNASNILNFIREKLLNDDITMLIAISDASKAKKPTTSREIFEELVQQNAALQNLSDEFDLELV